MAQILTHGSISSLAGLDAGDTVECYAVTRLSKLEPIAGLTATISSTTTSEETDAADSEEIKRGTTGDNAHDTISSLDEDGKDPQEKSGMANNGNNIITVRKSAIAFRYKSRMQSSDSRYSTFKPPFELTLEYGPQRTGLDMDSETVPMIQIHPYVQEEEGTMNKYVTWENEGKIYYEQSISSSRWDTADYIAPITGAVLSRVLEEALEYTVFHPRYQPFEVYDVSRESVIIRSSSSEDFVWYIYEKLAQMYVDIRPILTPVRSKIRLFVNGLESVKKQKIGLGGENIKNNMLGPLEGSKNGTIRDVSKEVVAFYETMYNCTSSVLNADYQIFLDEPEAPADTIESNTGLDESGNNKYESKNETSSIDHATLQPSLTPTTFNDSIKENLGYVSNDDETDNDNNIREDEPENSNNRLLRFDAETHSLKVPESSTKPSISPTLSKMDNLTTYPTPAVTNFTPIDEVQTAAQATAIAMSQTAQQNLLSGTGSLMTSALLPCISAASHDNKNPFFYLFVDGTTYYRLDLTYPYWDAVTLHSNMPIARPTRVGNGDFIDWMFVLMIAGGFLYGVYKILHKSRLIENDNFSICWSRLFGSSNYTDMNLSLDSFPFVSGDIMTVGGGKPHNFAQDAIPVSMGGKMNDKINRAPMIGRRDGVTIVGEKRDELYIDEEDVKDDQGLELGNMKGKHGDISDTNGNFTSLSQDDEHFDQITMEDPIGNNNDGLRPLRSSSRSPDKRNMIDSHSVRVQRDPDLVDLPNLVSTSKVAIPVYSASFE